MTRHCCVGPQGEQRWFTRAFLRQQDVAALYDPAALVALGRLADETRHSDIEFF